MTFMLMMSGCKHLTTNVHQLEKKETQNQNEVGDLK